MAKKDYGSSNRRKFLIGAGSLAAGGSALLGTAATTTFNLNERGVNANVVTDSDGAVALTDTEQGDIINLTDSNDNLGSGELEIDFAQGSGATGVNVGSVVNVGDFGNLNNTTPNDAAFTITNQTTDAVDVNIEFVAGSKYDSLSGGSEIKFQLANTDNTDEHILVVSENEGVTKSGDSVSTSYFSTSGVGEPLLDGQNIDVAIQVNADNSGSDTTEDLSGVLNITATQG